MKFVMLVADLRRELQYVGQACARSSCMPLLQGMTIEVMPEEMRLFATDLEVGLGATLGRDVAGVDHAGHVVVDVKPLADWLGMVSADKVVVEDEVVPGAEKDDQRCVLRARAGRQRCTLKWVWPGEDAVQPMGPGTVMARVESAELRGLLDAVIWVPVVAELGVRLQMDGCELQATATDRCVLATRTVTVEPMELDGFQVVVTTEAASRIRKLLPADEIVEIGVVRGEDAKVTALTLAWGHYTLTVRTELIEFPRIPFEKYRQGGKLYTMSVAGLKAMVGVVRHFCAAYAVLEWPEDVEEFKVSGEHYGIGDAAVTAVIDPARPKGELTQLGVDYLWKTVKSFDANARVSLRLLPGEGDRPGPVAFEQMGQQHLVVVMPMFALTVKVKAGDVDWRGGRGE